MNSTDHQKIYANHSGHEGRVAVVTGGSSGIGLRVAEELALRGSSVAILDIAEPVVPLGPSVRHIVCDVTTPEAVDTAFSTIARDLGHADIVVHNAGWGVNKPFLDISQEEQQKILDINFVAALNCCRASLPSMRTNKFGRIVFIGSDAARVGTPKETIYAGAKAALLGFAKALSIEVARDGITINVVSPGTTDTPLLRNMLTDEQIGRRVDAHPMRRLGTPDDVAAAVAYFTGASAGFVTGQILSVNGGMSRLG